MWKENNDNPSIEEAASTATTSIIIKVPGLEQMSGSQDCPPGHIGEGFGGSESYFFVKGQIDGLNFTARLRSPELVTYRLLLIE
ncbi:MAG: hypothetical protein WA364_15100 [Candidatus Nitrosopolaris sp.]